MPYFLPLPFAFTLTTGINSSALALTASANVCGADCVEGRFSPRDDGAETQDQDDADGGATVRR